jgi:PAS domain S-box-containing protein
MTDLKYDTIFKESQFGVVVHSESGEIIYLNESSKRILGLNSDQILGRKSTDPEWKCYKEDGRRFEGNDHPSMYVFKNWEKQENVVMQVYNPILNKNKWIKIDAYPIDQEAVKNVLVLFHDITKEKENEIKLKKGRNQFKALFHSTEEGIALHEMKYDKSGNPTDYVIKDVNPSYLRILNYQRENIINRVSREVYKVSEAPYLDIYSEVVRTGISKQFQAFFKPLDKYFSVSVVKYDEKHFATLFFDITSIKRDEKIIIDQIELLRIKNEEMEQLNYTVSHDLRSPLITIKGFAKQIEKDVQNHNYEAIKSSLEKINRGSDRIQYLLEDLLKYSKLGRVTEQLSKIDTEELIKELAEMFEYQLRERNAQIKIDNYLPEIYAEPNKIRELFQNLLENSLKFTTNTEQPMINIGYENSRFYFKDNGIGIEKAYFEKVFKVFEKLDKNTYGSGIGLSIVKKIINSYNCQIHIESDGINKGSAFIFELPLYNLKNEIFPDDSKYPSFISRNVKETF